MSKSIYTPRDTLIEKVAAEFACAWFEAAAATPGFNMERHKYKNDPRRFARMNLEKFIPQAVSVLIDMLGKPNVALELKEEIYDAIQDRINDPANVTAEQIQGLPDVDVMKILSMTKKSEGTIDQFMKKEPEKPLVIQNLPPKPKKATRH